MILDLVKRMEYIETVKIRFPDAQYSEFLNIRNWPKTFKLYIDDRKKELLDQKEDLYKEMSKEIEDVFEKIKGFKETIQEVLSKGLVDKELSYDDEENEGIGFRAILKRHKESQLNHIERIRKNLPASSNSRQRPDNCI